MISIPSSNPALILVDIQEGFNDHAYWGGARNNPGAEENARQLLELWRGKKLPLFHIQHCSSNLKSILHESSPGNKHKAEVHPLPDEIVIRKNVNSSFIGTNLKQQLDDAGIDTVIILGLTTDHCVSTTTRMAGNFGYHTFVVEDATATFPKKGINNETYDAQTLHLVALAQLKDEFATIVKTSEVIEAINGK